MLKKLLTISIVYGILCSLSYEVMSSPAMRTAKCTAYCSKCPDGGYSPAVAYKFKVGTCAADLRYHKRGSRVNIGGKWYVINNTGGAIKGRDRFDICLGQPKKCNCNKFGVKMLMYK